MVPSTLSIVGAVARNLGLSQLVPILSPSHRKRGRHSSVLQFAQSACQCLNIPQPLVALARKFSDLSLRCLFQVREILNRLVYLTVFVHELTIHIALEFSEVVGVSPENHTRLEVQPMSVQLHQTKS